MSQRLSRFGNHACDAVISQWAHREILFGASDTEIVLNWQSSTWRKTRFPNFDDVSPHGSFIKTHTNPGRLLNHRRRQQREMNGQHKHHSTWRKCRPLFLCDRSRQESLRPRPIDAGQIRKASALKAMPIMDHWLRLSPPEITDFEVRKSTEGKRRAIKASVEIAIQPPPPPRQPGRRVAMLLKMRSSQFCGSATGGPERRLTTST